MSVILSFLKMCKKTLFHTVMFHYEQNCLKNLIFVDLCVGYTFKLASMYYMRLFFILHSFIET